MNTLDNTDLIELLDSFDGSKNVSIPNITKDRDTNLGKISNLNNKFLSELKTENNSSRKCKSRNMYNSNKHTIKISDDFNLVVEDSTYIENDNFISSFISGILPEYSSENIESKRKSINNFKQRLAYDLDEKNLYEKFNYKKVFKKNSLQQELLHNQNIDNYNIRKYISDYFDIDILIVVDELLITSNLSVQKPFMIFTYLNNKLSLLNDGHGKVLFDSETFIKLKLKYDVVIDKLQSKTKYKAENIQLIANKLNIEITTDINGKLRNKKKDDIYDLVQLRLSKI